MGTIYLLLFTPKRWLASISAPLSKQHPGDSQLKQPSSPRCPGQTATPLVARLLRSNLIRMLDFPPETAQDRLRPTHVVPFPKTNGFCPLIEGCPKIQSLTKGPPTGAYGGQSGGE